MVHMERTCIETAAVSRDTSHVTTNSALRSYTTSMDITKSAIKCCSHSFRIQSSGAVWKSRWPSWAPVSNKPTVFVDVKQHSTNQFRITQNKAAVRVPESGKYRCIKETSKSNVRCFSLATVFIVFREEWFIWNSLLNFPDIYGMSKVCCQG